LAFRRALVRYDPAKGDHAFEITPDTLLAVQPGSTNANAAGYVLEKEAVEYLVEGKKGDRKKYTVFSNAFRERDSSTAKQRLEDTGKVSKLIERLTLKALR
jgi:hypothetical protein